MKLKYILFLVVLLLVGCKQVDHYSIKSGFYCSQENKNYFVTIEHNDNSDVVVFSVVNKEGEFYKVSKKDPEIGDEIEIVSYKKRTKGKIIDISGEWIVTTAYVEPGMSGSPILLNGEVIGIVCRLVQFEEIKLSLGVILKDKKIGY